MEQVQVKRASLFNRLIAKVIDLTLVFVLFILLDQFVVHPIANKIWDYDNLLTRQEEYYVQYNIGYYDEDGDFIAYEEYDLTDYENDVDAQALSKRIGMYQIIQWSVDIFIPEAIFLFILPLLLKKGRSLGKLLMKLEIINGNGEQIGNLNLFLRFFVGEFLLCGLLSALVSLPLCPVLSIIAMLVPPKHKSLMDYIGNTLVSGK